MPGGTSFHPSVPGACEAVASGAAAPILDSASQCRVPLAPLPYQHPAAYADSRNPTVRAAKHSSLRSRYKDRPVQEPLSQAAQRPPPTWSWGGVLPAVCVVRHTHQHTQEGPRTEALGPTGGGGDGWDAYELRDMWKFTESCFSTHPSLQLHCT